MRREDLHIPEPCHEDWDKMRGDDRKRFCDSCTKHVHNLSEMTREEAAKLLENNSNLCVQYASVPSGEVFFRDSINPAWRLHRQIEGTKKLLATALSIPLLAGALTGCDAQDTHSPDAVSPVIQINPDGTLKAPGSGVAPTFLPSSPPDEIEHLQGEPMIEPEKTEAPQPTPSVEPEKIERLTGDVSMEELEKHQPEIGETMGKVAIDHDPPKPDGETAEEPACDPGSGEDAVKSNDNHDDNIHQVGTPPSKPIGIRRGRMKIPKHRLDQK